MSELSDETRDLIARGREGVPVSARQRGAIRAGVLANLTAAAVIATTTTSTKTAAAAGAGWSSVALKVVGIAAVTAAVGGSALAIIKQEPRVTGPRPTAAAAATTVPSVSARPPAPAASSSAAEAPTVETAALPASAATVVLPIERGVSRPTGAVNQAGTAPAATDQGSVRSREADTEPSRQAPARSLEGDVLLLQDAHRALAAGDAARAVRLLDEHARRFPSSALEPERAAENVFALCQLRRVDAARAAAAAFLAAHPDGPLAVRVRGSCVKE